MKKHVIFIVFALFFSSFLPTSSIYAQNDIPEPDSSQYLDEQGGPKEVQDENEKMKKVKKDIFINTRGWGEIVRPSVPTYKQENNYFCGPASLQMVLESITKKKISQSSLAKSAGTSKNIGTYVYKMREVINNNQKKYKYVYSTVSNQNDLQKKVNMSIYKNAPVIFHSKTGSLYMYKGVNLGHYVVGHTIFQPTWDYANIYVGYNDPFYKNYGRGSVYGNHTDKLSNFYLSLTKWGKRYLIYA